MVKITFMGAGSSVYAKNLIGDCLLTDSLTDAQYALYDIDQDRLDEAYRMATNLNANLNKGRAEITPYLAVRNRRTALRGADFVVNLVQVGGYSPSTVVDFELPKKYGFGMTVGDTASIGAIFRALRTIKVLEGFANDVRAVCPNAWFLNYTYPMGALTGYLLRRGGVQCVGLGRNIRDTVDDLLVATELQSKYTDVSWSAAGLENMSWLLTLSQNGKDIYPEVRKAAEKKNRAARRKDGEKHDDMVRFELLRHFGYYPTGTSLEAAELTPFFLKRNLPELAEEFHIQLDEYPERCQKLIAKWRKMRDDTGKNVKLTHKKSSEYAAPLINAIVTNQACEIQASVLNNGLVTNLPADSVVEIPCLVNRNGVQGCRVGALPLVCAALNSQQAYVQMLTMEAAATHSRDLVYQAAMLDPHLAGELNMDDIRTLCDEYFAAHIRDGMLSDFN